MSMISVKEVGAVLGRPKNTLWHDDDQRQVLTSINLQEGFFPALTHAECSLISACTHCTKEALEAEC